MKLWGVYIVTEGGSVQLVTLHTRLKSDNRDDHGSAEAAAKLYDGTILEINALD